MLRLVKYLGLGLIVALSANAQAATWKNEQLGGFSSVLTYTPSTQSPVGAGRALMVVLHGCAQQNTAFKTAGLSAAADKWGIVMAVPNVVKGAGIANCWEYWTGGGTAHNRTSNDHKRVLDMVAALKNNASLNIDPNQVYIAGLSSGASFAHVTACIAPDVFAGFGSFAGPSPGTTSNGAISSFESRDVAAVCSGYASSYKSFFDTQIASLAQGEGTSTYVNTDGLVSKQYLDQNANGMAKMYGVTGQKGSETTKTNFGGSIKETLWANGRVSKVSVPGLGHAWPGGSGASGGYIDGASGYSYGDYLGSYFSKSNLRVTNTGGGNGGNTDGGDGGNTDLAPTISGPNVTVDSSGLTVAVSGSIDIEQGTVLQSVTVKVGSQAQNAGSNSSFNLVFNVSAGSYTATVTATALDANGTAYTSTATSNFTVSSGSNTGGGDTGGSTSVPSWCKYIASNLMQYYPQCAPAQQSTKPSWCVYIPAASIQYIPDCQ